MPPRRIYGGSKKPPLSLILSTESESSPQDGFTMEEELLWCINKLEASLRSESITVKSLKSDVIALKTLKSSKAPVVKKRQVMRMSCGDYRKAMTEELKRTSSDSKKMRLLSVKDTKSGSLINTKKPQSENEVIADSSFCFNFPLPADEELRLNFNQLKIDVPNVS